MSDAGSAFTRVVEIMRRLRAPDGCPWDREQTFDSIRACTLEETYEVLEAIGERDWEGLRAELGDLLLQVVFYAGMAEEEGRFDIRAVLETLADKLVRRHPHVFEDAAGARLNAAQALGRWEEMKAREKPAPAAPRSRLEGVPRSLPALAEAAKLGLRAAAAGFDWRDAGGVWTKLEEELDELRAARGGTPELEEELGDVLFTVVNLARRLGLDAESALKRSSRKFATRFRHMEAAARAAGRPLEEYDAAGLDALWNAAKAAPGNEARP